MIDTPVRDPPAAGLARRNYPAQLSETWHLEDQRSVTIRPVLPQDAVLTRLFVRQLSPESRYSRFLVSLSDLPPSMLVYLTDVDHVRHVGLVAVTQVYGRQVQVGEARYVIETQSADGATSAEFAIAVADDWQASGVGSRLLRTLEKGARAAGVVQLTGDVLGSNRKALDFLRQRGFVTYPNREEARLLRVEKNLLLAVGPPLLAEASMLRAV